MEPKDGRAHPAPAHRPGGISGDQWVSGLLHQGDEHPDRFRVRIEAHQSSVQGVSAAEELAAGIRQAEATQPDLIVLVRGGGGKLDLDAYNDFELCLAIARSTAPVWTGIGHESDLVVADLVAHTAWKTPTEVAVGVVKRFEEAAVEVDLLQAQLEHLAQTWLVERHREFESHWERIASASRHALNRHRLELQNLSRLLHIQAPALIERHRYTLREMRSTVARAGVHSIENAGREIRFIQQRLRTASTRHLAEQTLARAHFKRTLDAIGPEKTMQRVLRSLNVKAKWCPEWRGLTKENNCASRRATANSM